MSDRLALVNGTDLLLLVNGTDHLLLAVQTATVRAHGVATVSEPALATPTVGEG